MQSSHGKLLVCITEHMTAVLFSYLTFIRLWNARNNKRIAFDSEMETKMEFSNQNQIYIINEKSVERDSLAVFLESHSYCPMNYSSAEEFLAIYSKSQEQANNYTKEDTTPCCILCDMQMATMKLQEAILKHTIKVPLVIMTDGNAIHCSVDSFEFGFISIIQKPYQEEKLLEKLHNALSWSQRCQQAAQTTRRISQLDNSHQLVLGYIVNGVKNEIIAQRMGLSKRTIEHRRAKIMKTLHVTNFAELMRLTIEVEQKHLTLHGPHATKFRIINNH